MFKQLSVYMENRKGSMQEMLSHLSENGINISSFITNDSAEFGIIRVLASDPEKSREILTQNGYQCKLSYITGVIIEDVIGELDRLLRLIKKMNINVDYMYSDFDRKSGKAAILIQCESLDEVEEALVQNGYALYSPYVIER